MSKTTNTGYFRGGLSSCQPEPSLSINWKRLLGQYSHPPRKLMAYLGCSVQGGCTSQAYSLLAGLAEFPWICVYVIPWYLAECGCCQWCDTDVRLHFHTLLPSSRVLLLFPCCFPDFLPPLEQLELNGCLPQLGHH